MFSLIGYIRELFFWSRVLVSGFSIELLFVLIMELLIIWLLSLVNVF